MKGLPYEILVMDDDADDRFFMDEAFKKIGYQTEVKKFINPEALLRYLKQIDASLYPSLILLDDDLLGKGAKDVLSYLKANQAYQYIPVVIYSGVVLPSRKDELLSLGAYGYIEKGMSMDDFVHIATELKEFVETHIDKLK